MFSKFLNLDTEKQNRILNAAMKEFAQKGFENASTNEIVKEAKIGKGMLFHYFNSKKDLFLLLYDRTLEIVMNEYYGKIDLNEKDILKRFRQFISIKFMLTNKYPDMFNFIKTVNFEEADEVKKDLESRNNVYITEGYSKVLSDIDISKFRENVDINRAINTIIWTIDGLVSKEREKARLLSLDKLNYDELLAELDMYLELFKNSFYKE
jgi:AcrR family transcriptional regulator